ncbi:MAG: hypothetical protein ETSY1_21245 [Candidatus Entotheonella factor]|uniref:Adenylate cyclase n=1 Tax=Entotheonella factor TaxID=1429438 RepID=W4LIA1_ENTF1|nr:adenylate/guanylate cyclase domain-containing protein [Candidatus Entotheonella palauensis]ETW97813.1 MAG: hypothetical protein ETSY1_21245 [Candidatus Entotheonella factor]
MHQQTDSRAILFADISGSTSLYDMLGDLAAKAQVTQCMSILTEVTEKHGGTVIKTTGDGVLSTFTSAEMAVQTATAMHETLAAHTPSGQPPLSIRVGLHYGPVIPASRDIYGDAVNVAARVMDLAKPGQILTTKQIADMLLLARFTSIRHIHRTTVKGKQAEMDIYEVIWQEADLTMMAGNPSAVTFPKTRLRLRFGNQEWELHQDQPSVTIGRSPKSHLVVVDELASRMHARIEYHRGKFVLSDQSTNGTFVSTLNGKEIFLHRDALPLQGIGKITFGRRCTDGHAEAVHFIMT